MINVAIVGFGNVGRCVYDAIQSAPDMHLRCIAEPAGVPEGLENRWVKDIEDISKYGEIDVAILALPSRMCPEVSAKLLRMGMHTVNAFDIHTEIWETKCALDALGKECGKASILSAGWDPGTDSIIRALFEIMAPSGITYTDFGPGMSMGHTVAVKAIEGVENALSMTIPAGSGIHRRMVYVQLKPGADFNTVSSLIKSDPYFVHDETHVQQVDDVGALLDMGHGVNIARKGVSGAAHNQLINFSMTINNPALTAQVLVCTARAVLKREPGCYTMIELPMIDMLPGDQEALIKRLV